MSPKAQRIAIAEACGFTDVHEGVHPMNQWRNALLGIREGNELHECVPNYPDDLNAMHDAVDYANANQPDAWNDEYFLKTLCGFTGGFPHRATAAQWAKAFLDTLNLWDDSL